MRIVWSDGAVANLEAIHEYIARDAPDRAGSFIQRLIEATEPLTDFPQMGRVAPEGDGRHREVFCDPYRIIYRARDEEIYVVTVVHGSRDLASLLGERDLLKAARPQ